MAKRTEVIIENKTDKICLLIVVVISSQRNVVQKEIKRNKT